MKKRILRIGLVAVSALSLMGCGISAIAGTSDNGSKLPPSGITVNDIKYEVLNTVPEGIVTSNNREYKVVKQDNEYVVIIYTGEKPSSGYGVEVQSIKDTGGKTEITVKETEPKPGEMNATVITYPRVAIKIGNNIAPEFVVSNSKGDSFQKIDDQLSSSDDSTLISTEEVTGEFVGLADPHTVAIKIDGIEKSFQLNDRLAGLIQSSPIEEGKKVEIKYTQKDSQLWLISIEPVK